MMAWLVMRNGVDLSEAVAKCGGKPVDGRFCVKSAFFLNMCLKHAQHMIQLFSAMTNIAPSAPQPCKKDIIDLKCKAAVLT